MRLTQGAAAKIRDLLTEVAGPDPDPAWVRERAFQLLPLLTLRKPIKHALPGPSRKAKREEKRASRKARTAAIRDVVFRRAAEMHGVENSCELCASAPATELHHMVPGSGARRSVWLESPDTCAAVCANCHREWHRGRRFQLEASIDWAADHGFVVALASLEKRLAKTEEHR